MFDLRVGNPASEESTTNVRTSVDKTDQPAMSKVSIFRMIILLTRMYAHLSRTWLGEL